MTWQPRAPQQHLVARSELNHLIRSFFRERGVLEVETPLLSTSTASEPYLLSWEVPWQQTLFLQTSPEFAMKRLLAAGSGPIYQLCKAFRHEEHSPRHQPEFTILEWYRPGWTLAQLVQEIEDLIITARKAFQLADHSIKHITYKEAFQNQLGICPFESNKEQLQTIAKQHVNGDFSRWGKDTLLDLLMSHVIEPALPSTGIFVREFPASQAALADCRKCDSGHTLAMRAEFYWQGLEIANAYQELTRPEVLSQRYQENARKRHQDGLPTVPFAEELHQAMQAGLPKSAGVAVGVDRLLMCLTGAKSIEEVVAFPFSRPN